MRWHKPSNGYESPVGTAETLYLHDGQMPIEEATYSWSATRGNYSEIVRNGLGARGIDVMERVKTGTGAGTFYSYPVYDGHGNMIATLSKNGTGFSFGNQRAFDPWGTVRMWLSGGYAGFPSGRHVANLGHQMDDESGLVYMRARYYEAGSGRFISEDAAKYGWNWYAYASNDPVNRFDYSGNEDYDLTHNSNFLAGLIVIAMAINAAIWLAWRYIAPIGIVLGLGAYLGGTIGGEIGATTKASQIGSVASIGIGFLINLAQGYFGSVLGALAQSVGMGYSAQFYGYAGVAVATMAVYSIAICFVMINMESE